MSSFGFGSSPATSTDAAPSKEEVMNQVRSEMAVANAQALIGNINRHCFKLCVQNPAASLSSSEEASLSRCVDKYLSSWDTVSRAYMTHLQQQQQQRL
ncbi:protein translocase subunit [Coemansia sp. RSA 552]|nr:protein translocase subunit [Coemansia sp. RSA 552]